MRALGDRITRYNEFVQMIGDAFWRPTHHQHIMADETIASQCKTITQHILRVHAPDQAAYLKYQEIVIGTYIIVFSMMDTATCEDGV